MEKSALWREIFPESSDRKNFGSVDKLSSQQKYLEFLHLSKSVLATYECTRYLCRCFFDLPYMVDTCKTNPWGKFEATAPFQFLWVYVAIKNPVQSNLFL